MKTLVNGASFSRGPGSWPYHLKTVDQTKLVNLAQAGAGNTYIHESTTSELYTRSYDLVIIGWTGITRIDFRVSDIDMFSKSSYTSLNSYKWNDWAEKIIDPLNDQDYVQKDWVFGCGHINTDKTITDTGLFKGIYQYLNLQDFAYQFLIKVLGLQNTLKQMNIPYLFTMHNFENDKSELQKHTELYNSVDWNKVYLEYSLDQIMLDNNWYEADGLHPSVEAHKLHALLLDRYLNE